MACTVQGLEPPIKRPFAYACPIDQNTIDLGVANRPWFSERARLVR